MCGRYTLYKTDEIPARFNVTSDRSAETIRSLKKRYNISPTQFAPVIRRDDAQRNQLEMMRWGYMPVWAQNLNDVFKYSTYNARSEEIFEKRTWKNAIRHRRCLIPSTGFYEWKAFDGKQPYFIKPRDEDLFALAGIYGQWQDEDGILWSTYAIITTEAHNEVKPLHNRMPVILHSRDEARWLETDLTEPEDIVDLLVPYADPMDVYEVGRDVNSSRMDNETLVMPLNPK